MYCVVYMYLGFKQPLLDIIFIVNNVGFLFYTLYATKHYGHPVSSYF